MRRIAAASAVGVARRHEQAVLAVVHDLGHAADRGRDDRHADRERLDRRVRQVLPVAREQRGLGAGDDAQRLVARQRSPRTARGRRAPDAAAERSSSARSGPSPTTTSLASGTRAIASIATPSAFWRVSRPTKTNVSGLERSGSTRHGGGAGFVSTMIRVAGQAPAARRSRRGTRSGTTIVARAPQRPRPQPPCSARTGARPARLELLERAREQPVAPRALVGGVGDELRDERRRAAIGGGRRGRVGRRRVDDVGAARGPRAAQRRRGRSARERQPARDDRRPARAARPARRRPS